jgi:hypothetical protein
VTGLSFDAAAHEYRRAGRVLPSVTQVLQPYTGLEFVPASILEPAREFGTHVHTACDLYDVDAIDWSTLDDALRPWIESWARWVDDQCVEILASELRLDSKRYGYAGTLDAALVFKGRTFIIDRKTSAAVPRTVGPQTAAYQELYEENFGRDRKLRRACVLLRGDGQPARLRMLTDPGDWSVFLSALNLWRWQAKA